MAPVKPRFRLVNPERLRMMMERTGTGASISTRALAEAVEISHGTVDHLLKGHVKTQSHDVAHAIAETLGVDLLTLWAPTGRAVPADQALPPHVPAAP